MEKSNLCANCSGVGVASVYFELPGFAPTFEFGLRASTDQTDRWWLRGHLRTEPKRRGVLLFALASSGHRDGSLIRMKRIFRINRILLKL
jgi:hypothetical protein